MYIEYLTKGKYRDWDNFCYINNNASFFYTTKAMEFYLESSFSIKSLQKSFFVYDNNRILAVMPVFLEKIDDQMELGISGGPLLSPLIDETINKQTHKKVLKYILENLDIIIHEYGIKKLSIKISYLSEDYINQLEKYNYLKEYNFLEISNLTCILNLQDSLEEIYRNFSKGHKSAIKTGEKNLSYEIIDKRKITKETMDCFRDYYFYVAGKITRPQNTFDNLLLWIEENNGFLVKALYNNKICGYSYFMHYKSTAYYWMACKEKKHEELNISHYIQWIAIKHLKNIGVKYLELGMQDFADTLYSFPDEKDKNISKFKRGFGGFMLPIFIGEKFYSKEEFLNYHIKMVNEYANRNFK